MAIGKHYQNAYVTRDVSKATQSFRARADPRLVIEYEAEVDLWTPEGSGTGSQKMAFVWLGAVSYTHLTLPTIYSV